MGSDTEQIALREIVFGSAAGMIAKLFEHPFDLVKVRLQSQPTDRPASFTGPFDCFKRTYIKEGWRGLYRGISSPIVGAAVENATLFLVYEKCQAGIVALNPNGNGSGLSEKALGKRREISLPELALAGAGAGLATSFVLTPIELVKCRMQVQMLARGATLGSTPLTPPTASVGTNPSSIRPFSTSSISRNLLTPSTSLPRAQGPFAIMSSIVRQNGFKGLWLGQTGTLVRETGGGAAWFAAYEVVSRYFLSIKQKTQLDTRPLTKSDLSTWQLMLAGAAAGISYIVILFPADSIKSSVQTWLELHPNEKRLGFMEMGKKIWKTRGLKGLYAGCGVTCLKSGPSSAMIFALYETFQGKLGYLFD